MPACDNLPAHELFQPRIEMQHGRIQQPFRRLRGTPLREIRPHSGVHHVVRESGQAGVLLRQQNLDYGPVLRCEPRRQIRRNKLLTGQHRRP